MWGDEQCVGSVLPFLFSRMLLPLPWQGLSHLLSWTLHPGDTWLFSAQHFFLGWVADVLRVAWRE